MKLIKWIEKPLHEMVFFIVCLICIIPPTMNHFLLLFKNVDIDILVMQYLSIAITISYVMTTIVYLFRKYRLVKCLAYVSVVTLLFVFFFLKLSFGTNVSPLVVLMLAETNTNESLEFLHNFALTKECFISFAITIIMILAIVVMEKHTLKQKGNAIRHIVAALFIITLPVSIYATRIAKVLYDCRNMNEVNAWYDDYYPYAMDNISTLLYSIYIPHITANEIASVVHRTTESVKQQAETTEKDSLDVVFIIGESYIKYHAHLYGYDLPTTPIMDREQEKGNLYVFNNIISPYNSTTLVVKNVMCTNSISDDEVWSDGIYFPAIFKRAGFNVYMWDNQKTLGSFLIYTFTINSLIYNKQLAEVAYSETNNNTYKYDGELLQSLFKEKTGKHNLSIIHLMGQHVDASERYPQTFNRFSGKDIKRKHAYLDEEKKQSIAEYDNATLYNDSVIGMLFNTYRNKNAVVVYLSDHGEEIYDIRDAKGRNLEHVKDADVIRYQNDVPFVVWCSDRYKALHPDIINNLETSINRKGMLDNVCQLLFRLANMKTSFYKPERDITSQKYKTKKRIIYDEIDYDDIIENAGD